MSHSRNVNTGFVCTSCGKQVTGGVSERPGHHVCWECLDREELNRVIAILDEIAPRLPGALVLRPSERLRALLAERKEA